MKKHRTIKKIRSRIWSTHDTLAKALGGKSSKSTIARLFHKHSQALAANKP